MTDNMLKLEDIAELATAHREALTCRVKEFARRKIILLQFASRCHGSDQSIARLLVSRECVFDC